MTAWHGMEARTLTGGMHAVSACQPSLPPLPQRRSAQLGPDPLQPSGGTPPRWLGKHASPSTSWRTTSCPAEWRACPVSPAAGARRGEGSGQLAGLSGGVQGGMTPRRGCFFVTPALGVLRSSGAVSSTIRLTAALLCAHTFCVGPPFCIWSRMTCPTTPDPEYHTLLCTCPLTQCPRSCFVGTCVMSIPSCPWLAGR